LPQINYVDGLVNIFVDQWNRYKLKIRIGKDW
jgi:hypothetical protein